MQLLIDPAGVLRTLYDETLDLALLGPLTITRASRIEPDPQGQWWAEIVEGPPLGPFRQRSQALAAEIQWLNRSTTGPVNDGSPRLSIDPGATLGQDHDVC